MAKAQDIILQLAANIIYQTNLFSKTVSVTSLSVTNNIATAVTAAPHGYNSNDYIFIVGAQAPLQVTSLTQTNNIATLITSQPHDVTLNPGDNFIPTINVSGAAQAQYNGTNIPVLSVPDRYTLTYAVTGNPVSPATGSITVFDGKERGYNGLKQITVVNPTTFTYPLAASLLPAQGTITAHSNVRISGAATDERAVETYTKQNTNNAWAYVVLDDTDISKDRQILNDSTGAFVDGSDFRQIAIQNFHVLVIMPSTNSIAGRELRDLMEDVHWYINKSLLRSYFNSGSVDQTQFRVTSMGHGLKEYNGAFYSHHFDYELLHSIVYGDTIQPDFNVAFRDISLIIDNSPNQPATAQVNLDG